MTSPIGAKASMSEEQMRAELFGTATPKEKSKDEIITDLANRMKEMQRDNESLVQLIKEFRAEGEESRTLLEDQSKIIRDQSSIILHQNRKINEPKGSKWFVGALMAVAQSCFFFLKRTLSRVMERALRVPLIARAVGAAISKLRWAIGCIKRIGSAVAAKSRRGLMYLKAVKIGLTRSYHRIRSQRGVVAPRASNRVRPESRPCGK